MSSFVSYLISGISLGSVYAIIALGYTMVYGIAKMLNFAHGDVIMVGSYVVYVAVSGMGLNPILAILLSIIICTLMGVVIEGVAYRPLRNAASPLAVLITAIGVSYLLQNVALLIWGADTKSFSNIDKSSVSETGRRLYCDHRSDHCNDYRRYRDHGWTDGYLSAKQRQDRQCLPYLRIKVLPS